MNVFLSAPFTNSTGLTMQQLACVKLTSFTYSDSYGELAVPGDDVIGIVVDQVRSGERGNLAVIGVVTHLDTGAYPPGTLLYCGTSGYLTDTPAGQYVATVLNQDGINGAIYVNCTSKEAIDGGSITGSGSGNPDELAFWSSPTSIDSNPDLKIDASIKGLQLGTGKFSGFLGPLILLNNQSSPVLLLSYPLTGNEDTEITYSIVRDGDRRIGTLTITATPSLAGISDGSSETSPLGIDFTAIVNGSDIEIYYTTPNSGFNSNFRYKFIRWGGN